MGRETGAGPLEPAELEERIAALEERANEGRDLGRGEWIALLLGCLLLPALLLVWGYPS